MNAQQRVADASNSISYSLDARLLMTGKVAIVLQLYRSHGLALSSTLMLCDRPGVAGAVRSCRSHLRKLGVRENQVPSRRSGRLETASAAPRMRSGEALADQHAVAS